MAEAELTWDMKMNIVLNSISIEEGIVSTNEFSANYVDVLRFSSELKRSLI